jgi:hypothetical protein
VPGDVRVSPATFGGGTEHAPGYSCEACDCECPADLPHCPVHVRMTLDERQRLDAEIERLREALSLAEVEVALERSWCRACRTEGRGEHRGRDVHPHDARCALATKPGSAGGDKYERSTAAVNKFFTTHTPEEVMTKLREIAPYAFPAEPPPAAPTSALDRCASCRGTGTTSAGPCAMCYPFDPEEGLAAAWRRSRERADRAEAERDEARARVAVLREALEMIHKVDTGADDTNVLRMMALAMDALENDR